MTITSNPQSALDQIGDKVRAGERLSAEEGELLFDPEIDLHAVGELADLVRRRINGRAAYYIINAHLNPTNVCEHRCPLCAFAADAGDARAYVLDDEQILARGQEAVEQGCSELHIVGGLHPAKDFGWYLGIIRRLHRAFGQLHLKAWTAVEIVGFAQREGRPVKAILEDLIEAGLASLPGGGAEIFAPEVRRQICPHKADADAWLDVHRTAHRLGLPSNATMLYGHVETAAQRIDHLVRLRQLQDETGGFQAFVPLAFHPDNTKLAQLPRPSALLSLRTLAVSRLMLDNFAHVKSYWISLGVGMAQVGLCYGADDLDGTVRHEEIHHDAGSAGPEVLSCDELCALITEAGFEPVRRDSLYRREGG